MVSHLLLWLFCLLIVYSPLLSAQEKSVIAGYISSFETGKPIAFVNVYLANSLKGTTTDENGIYQITDIPEGVYQLIVSMMGYETVSKHVRVQHDEFQEHNFRLTPKILIYPEIHVDAAEAKEWKKLLKKFRKQFLGRTKFALQCEIINPEVLDFFYDRQRDEFKASAVAPLEIRNMALGYSLHGELANFNFTRGVCDYLFRARFEEIVPEDAQQENYWRENRRAAYKGSFQHFTIALSHSKIIEEGFAFRNVNLRRLKSDSLRSLLVLPGEFPGEIKLKVDPYLSVSYCENYRMGTVYSTISSRKGFIAITTSGRLLESGSFMAGYWATLRIASALPVEYVLQE